MKIIAIFIFSLTLRLLYLGSVPVSLSHDETDNIIQAHSVIQTGSDIEGKWKPWSLLPNSGVMAELGPLINVPILSIFPQSLFSARLTTAILSSLFPILIWLWLISIKVNSQVSLVSALLLAISPWHLIFSRTALEQPTSLFFYMLSWVFLAKVFQKGRTQTNFILYFISFILAYCVGYFTYHGYKFSFPILTLIYLGWLSYYAYPHRLIKASIIGLFIIGLVIRTLVYSSYYGSRSGELIIADQTKFSIEVNNERRKSIAPEYLKSLFVNKPIVFARVIRDKYINAISPDMLFLHGESNGVFSVSLAGYLYLFTLPILLIGLVSLFRFSNPTSSLILALLSVSPLATIVHINNSYAFRSAIYFVLLNIVLGYGLIYLFELIKQHVPKLWQASQIIITILFMFGLASFCYILYFVTPVNNANDYFFSDRLIANYVRLNNDHKVLVIAPQPRYIYSAILLAQATKSNPDILSFNNRYSPSELDIYEYKNIYVTRSCPNLVDTTLFETIIINKNLIAGIDTACPIFQSLVKRSKDIHPLSLVAPRDSGEEHRIIGDSLCQGLELGKYVHPKSMNDFNLEKMSKEEFCTKWIVAQ